VRFEVRAAYRVIRVEPEYRLTPDPASAAPATTSALETAAARLQRIRDKYGGHTRRVGAVWSELQAP
jgi:hypothetical protein